MNLKRTAVCAAVAVALGAGAATKEDYLDLIETAVGAYTPERIDAYVAQVDREGITEHGFARLTANLAIAVAHGRYGDRVGQLERLMDLCAREQPIAQRRNGSTRTGHGGVGAEFAVKELVFALGELERAGTFPKAKTDAWRAAYRPMKAAEIYTVKPKPGDRTARNWVIFGTASEQSRIEAGLGGDPAWVERYVGDQLRFFDANGMYRDPGNPTFYDLVPRLQYAVTLDCGYDGPSRAALEAELDRSAEATLAMQSVTGEIPFGGRSMQFLHNEILYAALCEWYAKRYARQGDRARATRFRSAADRAVRSVRTWTRQKPLRHIKNRFPTASGYGCETYAYFNKYMVTMGSWAYLAYRFADESVPCDAAAEDSVFVTGPDFHRVMLNAKDYTLQFDLDGQTGYDASGLGRIQRRGAPPAIALSVPFPTEAHYRMDVTNDQPLAIGPRWTSFALVEATKAGVTLGNGGDARWTSRVTDAGVEMEVAQDGEIAFALPAFAFDGESETRVTSGRDWLQVAYRGWVCRYETDGFIVDAGRTYGNRNGHYRLFEARGRDRLAVRAKIVRETTIYSRMTPVKGERLCGEDLGVEVRFVKDLNLLPRWEGTRFADAVKGCAEYQAECDEAWSRLAAAAEAARKGGYRIALESDELKFARPVWERLLKEFPDPENPNRVDLTAEGFWEVYRAKYREILAKLPPEVTAVMIRTGENYSYLNRSARGQTLCDYRAFGEKYARNMARIIEETRRLVADEAGLTLIWRTWDCGNDGFHANPDTFDRVMAKVRNRKGLLLSIKFCETDYWAYNRFNPCIGRGGWDLLIEAQTSREYEGKSVFPNYMGFEHGAAFRRAAATGCVNGWWIWGLGTGGWAGPYLKNDVWYRMNFDTTRALARNPDLDPGDVLREWCADEFGEAAADTVAAALAQSHDCVVKAFYVGLFGRRHHGWLPSGNLVRDDVIRGGLVREQWLLGGIEGLLPMYREARKEKFNGTSEFDAMLAEKREASALARQMRETFESARAPIVAAKGERAYLESLTGLIYLEKLVKVMEHYVNGMFLYFRWQDVRTEELRAAARTKLESWRTAWADYNASVPTLPAAPTLYRSLLSAKAEKDEGAMVVTCEAALKALE